jgi:hypothetical protein
MGIFVGIAVRDCYTQTTRHVSQRMRRKILRLLGANESTLPQYHHNNQSSPEQAIASNNAYNARYSDALICETASDTVPSPELEPTSSTEMRSESDHNERPNVDLSHGLDLRRTPTVDDGTAVNPWADN